MYRYLPLAFIVIIAAINTTTQKVGLASKEPFRQYPRPKNRRVSKGNHLPCLRKKVESREDIQASLVLSPHSSTHQSKSRRSRSSLPPSHSGPNCPQRKTEEEEEKGRRSTTCGKRREGEEHRNTAAPDYLKRVARGEWVVRTILDRTRTLHPRGGNFWALFPTKSRSGRDMRPIPDRSAHSSGQLGRGASSPAENAATMGLSSPHSVGGRTERRMIAEPLR